MRVILDANVLLSFAIGARGADGVIGTILRLAIDGRCTLLLSPELLREVRDKLQTKRYFVDRFNAQAVDDFIAFLVSIGHLMPPLTEEIPAVTRDRKDNYLVAAALIGEADYLVSGDRHLLELGDALAPLKIRSPRAFVEEFLAENDGRGG